MPGKVETVLVEDKAPVVCWSGLTGCLRVKEGVVVWLTGELRPDEDLSSLSLSLSREERGTSPLDEEEVVLGCEDLGCGCVCG